MNTPTIVPPLLRAPPVLRRTSGFARALALTLALGFLGGYVLLIAGEVNLPFVTGVSGIHSAEGGGMFSSPEHNVFGFSNSSGGGAAHHSAHGCGGAPIPVPHHEVSDEDT